MLIKLFGNKQVYKMNLPEIVEGNYWLCDNLGREDEKLINIKSSNENWFITSNKYSKVINEDFIEKNKSEFEIVTNAKNVLKEMQLETYKRTVISIKNRDELYIAYCFPTYEKNIKTYNIANVSEFTIGSALNNDIVYKDKFVKDTHARIIFRNGRWHIENYDSIFGTFINDEFLDEKSEIIENGDIISILGIRLMIIGKELSIIGNTSFITITNPQIKMCLIKHQEIQNLNLSKDDDEDVELYKESDYFYRAPRIMNKIEKENIHIDQPPKKEGNMDSSQFLLLFSTASMSIVTVVILITTLSSAKNPNADKTQIIVRLITAAVMLISMLIIPIIRMVIIKRSKKKKEEMRQHEYKKYINTKIIKINEIMEKQSKILKENNMIAEQCERIILERSNELWERQIEDEDFININIGKGDQLLDIGIDKTEPKFSLEEDNLLNIYYELINNSKVLEGVPITVPLTEKNIVAFISDERRKQKEYMENIILQLVALQNYRNLKLVFFVKNEKDWAFVKLLPHVWNDSETMRFFATNGNDMKELSQYLEEIMSERNSVDDNRIMISKKQKSYKEFDSYYVIITDNYKYVHNLGIINKVLNNENNLGFSLMCITNNITQLPPQCKIFIELSGNSIKLFESDNLNASKKKIDIDESEKFDYPKISKVMANIPINYTSTKSMSLPEHYNFLEMYNCGNIEQLNILDRWNNNDSTMSLQAKIGIDPNGSPIYLDAHEKYHGPHGIIAGTTGSGKSEFIITYILSLAINYHPDDVTFILIDYKGGGLAGAFKKKNIQLPHLVGTITNIDSVGLQRSLESIQSELKRRQIMFNEAKNITNESTIDIYKYQKFYHEGLLKNPISHLFIICDEFAELKQQQPEFMAELMSVSRIGRSLGVHLILATQKPAGIVNDQIRSNSKFGICLKVQDRSDSKDIIKKPDAATLKNAGQFYINVGNDEYFALGQSAYTGVPYIPSDVVKKEENNSIEFVSNIGFTIKKIEENKSKKINKKSNGDQLTNIVYFLADIASRNKISEKQLWLDPIPEKIYVKDLRRKYNVKAKVNVINPIIGEYDDPSNQLQGILTLNFTREGNTIIYGSSDSGKELILESILYDSMLCHSSEEVQFYLIDFGNEVLRNFNDAPHVRDILLMDDQEKIMRLFKILKLEIKERKQKLLEYNGDYNLYLKNSGHEMPMIVVIINEYGNFSQNYGNYEEEIISITKECTKYGIVFVATGSAVNDFRLKLVQNFKRKIALQLINDDYSFVFSKARKKKPSSLYGRGLITLDSDIVYEFQSARMCNIEQIKEFTKSFIAKLKKKNKVIAPSIPVVPNLVTIDSVKDKIKNTSAVPIGISEKNVKPFLYNFEENIVNIITAKDIECIKPFIISIMSVFKLINNVDVVLIDLSKLIDKSEFDFVEKFNNLTKRLNSNLNKRENVKIIYIIIGIDMLINNLGTEKELFTQNLNAAQESSNCYFIVVDTVTKIKAHQLDSWYRNYVGNGNGIYIGNGFDSQFVITYEADRREINPKCGNSFGYVVRKSKPKLIKLLGVEEKRDDDE